MTQVTERRGPTALALVFNVRILRVLGQLLAIVVLVTLAVYLRDNYQANSRQAGRSGWGFLDEPTGFNIANADFRAGQPVRDALLVGVKNTALAAAVGMVLAVVLGVVVGVLRLSQSWVARKAATLYVEILRNVPVLLIILFVGAWLRTLPQISDAQTLARVLVLSNRTIAVASPIAEDSFLRYVGFLAVALAIAVGLGAWRTRVSAATGAPHHRLVWGGVPLALIAVVGWVALGAPVTWSRPEVTDGLNVSGGAALHIPYVALTGALALYHASHIAEIVRGSIQAVPHGQTEAATAVGLSSFQRLRFVILPQAFRIAVPPTINQLLSLTKNTSLGIVVAYSDVFSLGFRLIGARAPALQTTVILMAVYLMFSLVTSVLLNLFNRRLQLVER